MAETGLPLRVLLAEDSEDDALLLVRELRRGGYAPQFARVDSAAGLRAALAREAWDLVITDHNMPHFDSADVLAIVRATGTDLPLIIVSGSIGEEVAVAAMKAGAHDYIMKTNLARLVPAVDRELREAERRRAHREAQETIRRLAFHDALTGLANRHEFEQRLREALATVRERGVAHTLLYLDLDQFKIVNDTCGHVAGDELLRRLATLLRTRIRDRDTLARLGGDEFGVLLETCPLAAGERIAEDILKALRAFRFAWLDKVFTVGASIGVVPVTAAAAGIDELLAQADLACYAAKDLGRNRAHVYAEGDRALAQRQGEMHWVARVTRALEDGRLVLFRQCIASLNDRGGARHCEFLVRLTEPDGAIVGPDSFIPAAERYGLMPQVDRWVIHAACAYLAGRAGEAGAGTYFVNLSATSLGDGRLADYVRAQLAEHRLAAGRIGFEITETAAIANFTAAAKFIRDIREAGCPVALDDFGAGMSSFSYLKSMPVDYLKIEGSFVRSLLHDPMDGAIVESINRIGHVAGIRTIAEFVETEAVLARLVELGVDYAQGYAIERPRPCAPDAEAANNDNLDRQDASDAKIE